ncbi:MAG: SUMF1/EgtB/PvdO family nonheme iron enzyme [Tepidisphaerales bacterium]
MTSAADRTGTAVWLGTEADIDRLDWYGGEPTEIIRNSSPSPQLASAALETVAASGFEPVPRWSRGGFNLKADSGQVAGGQRSPGNRWSYRCIVVPHWTLFLLLAWAPALRLRQRWIRRQRRKRGLCLNCGYDVRASGEVCSECGQSLRTIEPAGTPVRRWRRGRWAAGVLVAGVTLILVYVCGQGERPEPVVRLGPATTLPAGPLPRQIELEVGGGLVMRFVLIPSGRFLMGSPPSEVGRREDERQHEVIISRPFYMGVSEVTQEQYQAVMDNNPSEFMGAKNPVETVSWDDAVAFCRKLSERSGYKAHLPTEAEWEYACRAGTATPFHTGRTLPRDTASASRPTIGTSTSGSGASWILPGPSKLHNLSLLNRRQFGAQTTRTSCPIHPQATMNGTPTRETETHMKRSIGARTPIYPTSVWIVGSYDKRGRPNGMTAAWGGVCCSDPRCVAVSPQKATHT